MPRVRVKRFNFYFVRSVGISEKPKLERAKLAFDNLECSKVRGTGVLRRSSTIAVETRYLDNLRLYYRMIFLKYGFLISRQKKTPKSGGLSLRDEMAFAIITTL